MKTTETALKEWAMDMIRFDGGKDCKIWSCDVFRVLTEAFRKLDGKLTVELAVGDQSVMRTQMTALVDWFQVKCAHKILEELKLFHLVTPIWLAQCGSWAGVAKATRPYRKVEAKRIYDADHGFDQA